MKGDIALDTSVVVEATLATRGGRKLIELMVREEVTPRTTSLNVTEALHVLCRLLGFEEAERRASIPLDSGYLNVVNHERLSRLAALCECLFPISIAYWHTLALAKMYGIPALFYRPERELQPLLEKLREWLGGDVLFLMNYL